MLLSTDASRELYDSRAESLFKKYGGGDWPSAILENSFEGALTFGDFGYGVVIVDAKGIVRAINPMDLQLAVDEVFKDSN